jgi:cell division transport system permease protein
VVAIMTFLCALLVGAATLVTHAAGAWSATVLDEITVTVLPLDADPIEGRLQAVADLLAASGGLADVAVVPAARSEALLSPWLGAGVDLALLPVPRLVTARRAGDTDIAALRRAIAAVPGASLDDHGAWSERLWRMASAAVFAALAALALMAVATAITIVFATRSAIAENAATVEVLDALGAEESFVAGTFRRRFVAIGARGAAAGALVALGLFAALDVYVLIGGAGSAQSRALFGEPSIGVAGYGAILAVALGATALVAATATLAVKRSIAALRQ